MIRAILADRDGVVIRAVSGPDGPLPPQKMAQMEVTAGTVRAVARARRAGLPTVLVTNQPDIARGLVTAATVDEMHARLRRDLQLEGVFVCPHDDADSCGCRKPKPGLILAATAALGVEPVECALVGDRWRDVEAGRTAGCTTFLVASRSQEPRTARCRPHFRVPSFAAAVDTILSR